MLGAVLDGRVPPGRYRLSPASRPGAPSPAAPSLGPLPLGPLRLGALRTEIAAAGWTGRVIDGGKMRNRATMFDGFAAALEFPGWFGRNWDAFADCLGDLSWLPGAGIVVLWQRSGIFARAAPDAWHTAGRVIDDAIAARIGYRIAPLYVIYPGRGDDPGTDDRPGLSGGDGSTLRPVR